MHLLFFIHEQFHVEIPKFYGLYVATIMLYQANDW